jgi:hypothetical protein
MMSNNVFPSLSLHPDMQFEDGHGAAATVYYMDDGEHKIIYTGSDGHAFYTEVFDRVPYELVTQYAHQWAQGRRSLYVDVTS